MSVFDVLAGIILFLGTYKGFRSGLIKSLGGILGWIGSIVVALSFYQPLADYLDKQFGTVSTFGEFIVRFIPLPSFSFEADNINMAIVNAGVQEMALPDFLKRGLSENIDRMLVNGPLFDVSLSELIAYGLAVMILNGISFLMLFLAAGIIIKIGVDLLSRIFAVSPLGPINKLAGAALGFAMNLAIITVIVGLISPVIILSATQNVTIAEAIYFSLAFTYLLELFLLISDYIFEL